jgi:hypothetical protein
MATQPDLWGDIQVAAIRTPAAILREQAALLGQKTQNVIEARVDTETYDKDFHHYFRLIVPALDNYTYELFSVRHSVELYPVKSGFKEFKTESEFTDWLREKLSSPETRKIVGNLLAQANS